MVSIGVLVARIARPPSRCDHEEGQRCCGTLVEVNQLGYARSAAPRRRTDLAWTDSETSGQTTVSARDVSYMNWLRALPRARATASGPAGNRSWSDTSLAARCTAVATSDSGVTVVTFAKASKIGFAKLA